MVAQRVFILHAQMAALSGIDSSWTCPPPPGREPFRKFKPMNKRQKEIAKQKSGKKKR